ncbi:MAG: histidine kinase [Desulfobacteraceae bacterium]|jgi:two-component system NtrC family sensor kinase|nr:MAG: histidine kinase [Desulfobacteraceae bacterium]
MTDINRVKDNNAPACPTSGENYHRRLKQRLFVGLLIAYLIPITLLTIYFNYKFDANVRESSKLQLAAAVDSQRNTIDLFMQKRIVNLFNLFHLKAFSLEPDQATMDSYLANLIRADNAFVDVGLIDPDGIQTGYAGPYPHLRGKDYSHENWYQDLANQSKSYIITDLYLGLRRQPHFTIGVKQIVDGRFYVVRSSVYPDKLGDLLIFSRHGKQASGYLVNREGIYQAASPGFGDLLTPAFYRPGLEKETDVADIRFQEKPVLAAHTWLREVPWCLVMLQPADLVYKEMYGLRNAMIVGSAFLVLVIMGIVWIIIRKVFHWTESLEQDRAELKSQLYHAHKLVSVGQLAGGVAHEINNPLAIIESESGLIRDMLNPSLALEASPEAIVRELDEIDKAVHRAKGVTQKILSFVRKTDPELVPCDVNKLFDDVVSGVKEQEFKVSNISLIKDYALDLPELMIDPGLLRQVLLNLINNASDAVAENGAITLRTRADGDFIKITVADTGEGMSPEKTEKIFMPFFTTKEVGKGTGLGLPISLNIVEGFGGRIEVRSTPGAGSEFTVVLPVSGKSESAIIYTER